jgi:hypothetical protein
MPHLLPTEADSPLEPARSEPSGNVHGTFGPSVTSMGAERRYQVQHAVDRRFNQARYYADRTSGLG